MASATTATAAADGDSDDEAVQDEKLTRTVIVRDVSADMEDVVLVYLENPRKNGGPIETCSYNTVTNQLSICFVSQQGVFMVILFYRRKSCFYKDDYTRLRTV